MRPGVLDYVPYLGKLERYILDTLVRNLVSWPGIFRSRLVYLEGGAYSIGTLRPVPVRKLQVATNDP